MKLFKYIIIGLLAVTFLSCETEADLDLKTAEPRLVIDASLGAMQPCNVKLTMTRDYWNQDPAKGVSDAVITISDDKGNSEVLKELGEEGLYVSRMLGQSGRTYTLSVVCGGVEYIATDYLPYVVPIDGIRSYKIDTGGDQHFFPCISFIDPVDVNNYYYYLFSINGRFMQGTRFEDDKYWDGKLREPILFFDKEENYDEDLKVGDLIFVEMQSIGKGSYRYFETITSPGGAANSNPESNFSGDVLGMFKTYSKSYIEMTIIEDDLK